MRRCYAHVPAAENPLRPEAPKSPWSRRIPFPAPSGHFRIVLFLIGLIGCLCLGSLVCRSVYRFFFVLYPASVSYGFVLRFSSGAYAFRPVLMAGFSVSVFVSPVVAHPSLRSVWMGGLRDSLFVLRSGWSSVFPLPCSRFVLSARSFALRSPSFLMILVLSLVFFFLSAPFFILSFSLPSFRWSPFSP